MKRSPPSPGGCCPRISLTTGHEKTNSHREDSGHFGHVDAPGQFAQTVVDFVRSTPA
jgi:hypothetical protein